MNDFLIEELKRGEAVPVAELREVLGHRAGVPRQRPIAEQISIDVQLWFDPLRRVLCYRRVL